MSFETKPKINSLTLPASSNLSLYSIQKSFPMSSETKPDINSLTTSPWSSELLHKSKPVVYSNVSEASTIPELILYLKSAFLDRDFSLVQEILVDRDKRLRIELEKLRNDLVSVRKERDLVEKNQATSEFEKMKIEEQLNDMRRKCEQLTENVTKLKEDKSLFCDRESRAEERYQKICEELAKEQKDKHKLVFELNKRMQELKNEKAEAEAKISEELAKEQEDKRKLIFELNKRIEELKNEKAEAEARVNACEQRFQELDGRMSRLEEELALKHAVDVSIIKEMAGDLVEETSESLEVIEQASGVDRETSKHKSLGSEVNLGSSNMDSPKGKDGLTNSHEVQFSPGSHSGCSSTVNGSRKSGREGSGNMDFIPTKQNLLSCPDATTLPSMPSAQLDNNGFNEEKEVCCSGEADLPVNLACESRDSIRNLSAHEAEDCFKNKLDTFSGKPVSLTCILIDDDDEEMDKNEMSPVSNICGLGRNLTFPHQIKEEDIKDSSLLMSKRKRSSIEGDSDDSSSFGRQKTRSIQELVRDGKQSFVCDNSTNPAHGGSEIRCVAPPPEPKPMFIRRCDDKVGIKSYSQPPPRRSDLYNDSCSDKNKDTLIKRITESRKWLFEDGLRSSFEKDPGLCMNAVCALYRQQVSPNVSSNGLLFTTSQGLSNIDRFSITALGEYLIDGDPQIKLRKAVSEVRQKDHDECKRLATKYCNQLFEIYHSKVDYLFCPGAICSKF